MFKNLILLIALIASITLNSYADNKIINKNDPSEVKDCFEKINRVTFSLNMALDNIIFEPVAKAYKVLPSPVRSGVNNSLSNLSNLVTIPNNLLQGEFKKAGNNTGRFVINTTIGVLGFIDVAEKIGLAKYEKEDYGQTLAVHGLGPGCYIVLPVLGPSTVRDAAGTFINTLGGDPWYTATVTNNNHYFEDSDYFYTKLTDGIDFRSKNIESFESIEKNSVDLYASMKSLYLQDRQKKILNSSGIVDTMDDSDWDEIEN